jgi:hypothetical protein
LAVVDQDHSNNNKDKDNPKDKTLKAALQDHNSNKDKDKVPAPIKVAVDNEDVPIETITALEIPTQVPIQNKVITGPWELILNASMRSI